MLVTNNDHDNDGGDDGDDWNDDGDGGEGDNNDRDDDHNDYSDYVGSSENKALAPVTNDDDNHHGDGDATLPSL